MNKRDLKLIKSIRTNILKLTFSAKSSHIGSSLSIVEILYTLYFNILKKNDRFILSKGHAALALYCILYEKGIINKNVLNTFGHDGTKLMAHVSHKVKGVEFSTGSLGHGLPVAVGKALKFKLYNNNSKIFVLLSDGELNEGSNWEALLFASHHNLKNLIIIIDYNKIQSLGSSKNIINIEPLKKKFLSFGFSVIEVNGHNIISLKKTFLKKNYNRPRIVIAHTIKGYGVTFMHNKNLWHYKSPNKIELKAAINEINKKNA